MKVMRPIVRIGVNLVEGCTISGGEKAIEHLSQDLHFTHHLKVNQELMQAELPLFLHAVKDLNARLKQQVQAVKTQGKFPLVFGGDHALAIGSIAGSMHADTAVLWIDAHGDCNTPESSNTQRIHGMPLATLLHQGHPDLVALVDQPIKAKNILMVGVRDLDEQEEKQMVEWGVRFISMPEIRHHGLKWLYDEVMCFVQDKPNLHISFDCDSMNPKHYPGVNTAVEGGFEFKELHPLFEQLFALDQLSSMDIVEYNPTRDDGHTHQLIIEIDALLQQLRPKV